MSVGKYNVRGHQAIFRPNSWVAPEVAVEACEANPELSLTRIYIAAGSLSLMQRLRAIPAKPSRIFEFGSGFGEGLAALDMYARMYSIESITGSEIDPDKQPSARAMAASLELVDELADDGIAHLNGSPAARYGLIFANMFGPAIESQELIAGFIRAGLPALSEDGAMVINSDHETMANVRSYVAEAVAYPTRVITPYEPQVPLAFKAEAISHVVIQKPAAEATA